MTILVISLAAWLVLGWKIGAALAVGACLEFIEAAVLWRGLPGNRVLFDDLV
jgi:NhaP-type Na+/H+ or K+/H+ antiporter